MEKRRDATDGKMRTWEQFMMLHAQGACFAEADRLWEQAGPRRGEAENNGTRAHEEEDDGPPQLLEEPDSPIASPACRTRRPSFDMPKRVRFALDASASGLSLRSIAESEGSVGHSEDSPTLPPSVLKSRSRVTPPF